MPERTAPIIPPRKGEGGRRRRKGGLRPPFFQSRTPTQSVGDGGVCVALCLDHPPTRLAALATLHRWGRDAAKSVAALSATIAA
jgi:hypothetical protein